MLGSLDSTTRPLVKINLCRTPPLPPSLRRVVIKRCTLLEFSFNILELRKVFLLRGRPESKRQSTANSFKKQVQKDYFTRYISLRFISVIQSNLQKAWNELLNATHFKTEVANLYSKLRLRNNAIHYFA